MMDDVAKLQEITNVELANRAPIVYPAQPPSEVLFKDITNGIYLGRTEFLNTPVYWNPQYLTNPHIVIVGISGSGKSYTIKSFLVRASFVWNANAIIIDWAGEYREWVSQVGGKVIKLGAGNYLNLLDLGQMKPYARIKQILETLRMLAGIGESEIEIRLLEKSLENVYTKAGFKLDSTDQYDALGRPLQPPTLKDVVKDLEEKRLTENLDLLTSQSIDALIYKLKQFTRPGDDFFSNPSTLSLDTLISSGLVDLDLSELPNETMRALGALTVIQFIKERMRLEDFRSLKGRIRLFVVIDEAWKISKDENSDIVMIVREGRKYGFSLIVASQNPTDIAEAIFSNSGTVLMLKIKFDNYLDYLQRSLKFSNFVRERIQTFGVGVGALNMSFYISGKYPNTAIVKIDGEQIERDYFIMLNVVGDPMGSVSIPRDDFISKLRSYGMNISDAQEISMLFEKNNYRVDIVSLVVALMRKKISRRVLVEFLKELGLEDTTIAKAISKAQLELQGGDSVAEIKLG